RASANASTNSRAPLAPFWPRKSAGRKIPPLPSNKMMPSEPDHKMDELLRKYASRRREDAAPSELHPATRRLLQTEIHKSKSSAPPSPGPSHFATRLIARLLGL